MNVLILDDDPARHPVLQRQVETAFAHLGERINFAHTYTLSDFLNVYPRKKWEVVLLDHDLYFCQPPELIEGELASGLQAARLVAKDSRARRPSMVIVHSLNPIGGSRMMQVLTKAKLNAVRAPFDESKSLPFD